MIAIPAIDLRSGACVQLVGGSYAEERVRINNPVAAAQRWTDAGFRRLHVVDLDAAVGVGNNADPLERLLTEVDAELQVGGGVRTSECVAQLLSSGAARIVIGTRAIDDPDWLEALARAYPGRIIVAADVRGRQITTHGWTRTGGIDVAAFIRDAGELPLAGVLITAVQLEGRMGGTDLDLMEEIAGLTPVPVIASGGIASAAELRELAQRGVSAAVLGMSLYTGVLDARAIAEEFSDRR
jgi:phosphoribosylformimino-5-aminoimidazole carboxamide ribotide isomerase